jgi:hypothetical protein
MTRLPRYGALLVSGLLLGACAQLIGLSDYESVSDDDDAGEDGGGKAGSSGKGGSSGGAGDAGGKAGSEAGGKGGSSGAGGSSAGRSSGGEAGEGGEPPVAGRGGGSGEGGEGGEGGAGGSPSGGSAGVSGAAGSSGSNCTEITGITFVSNELTLDPPYPDKMVYHFAPQPSLGMPADMLDFEFYSGGDYNGEATGSFNLAAGDDGNYESCARCVYAQSDGGSREYFQASGTMIIDSASRHMAGAADFSITDVTLVEVDIASNLHSTPVPNGRCLHITTADVFVEPPVPDAWTCGDADYRDDLCDCGCGAVDVACDTSYGGSCEFCSAEGSCSGDEYCAGINVENNAICTGGPVWNAVCGPAWYADGECDCGCGSVDLDCGDALVGSCLYCWCGVDDAGSCEGANLVNATDNSQCDPATP